VIERYHNKSINDEVEEFAQRAPSLENLLDSLWSEIEPLLPSEVRLTQLRLEEMPTLFGEKEMTDSLVKLTRVYEFAASHRLHADGLTAEENIRLFGKCNHIHGHGHNYTLEVTVAGSPDPISGMMCPLEKLDDLVENTILKRYDHRNLNLDLPEYEGRNTTSEVVALQIFDDLKQALTRARTEGAFGNAELHRVRVHETARNIFEVTG
jgi:6-pyruvoyltetrahydropterin/6-carboxytetrahydropterin synthase